MLQFAALTTRGQWTLMILHGRAFMAVLSTQLKPLVYANATSAVYNY